MAYMGGPGDVGRAHDPDETGHLDLVAGKGRAGRPALVVRNPGRVRIEGVPLHVHPAPRRDPRLVRDSRTAGRRHPRAGHPDRDRGAGSLVSRPARPPRVHQQGVT